MYHLETFFLIFAASFWNLYNIGLFATENALITGGASIGPEVGGSAPPLGITLCVQKMKFKRTPFLSNKSCASNFRKSGHAKN